jgi:linoleoyl-CoA desaturase
MAVSMPRFPVVKHSLHNELKKRVQQYFDENGISETGNSTLYIKAIVLVSGFVLTYLHLMIFQPVWWVALLECVLLAGFTSGIGFNLMHDGSHGSFSKSKVANRLAGFSINLFGASHYLWNVKHNMIHHSFTNVDGVDDDIEVGSLMRFAPTQKRHKLHRLQHLYFGFLYALLYIFWVFVSDYKKYFTRRIAALELKPMTFKEHAGFWLVKIFHALVFVVLPIMVWGWAAWLIGFVAYTFITGFTISIVFQLAHTVEHTEFPVADIETNKLPDEFAAHQIKTTANFATNNKLISWLVGGLNFQIEHHLFPKISHVHYPKIHPIVKEVCQEYQLQYIEYPTMGKAIMGHVRFLKALGKKD